MNRYTLFCTPEQTKKALELGAPIEFEVECPVNLDTLERSPYPDIKMGEDGEPILINPTAEQMIGWLESQRIDLRVADDGSGYDWSIAVRKVDSRHCIYIKESDCFYDSRKEATLNAISAALEYLSNNK